MIMKARLAPLLLVALLVAACTGSPQQTVAYFRAHKAERLETVRRCADDPGTLSKTAACINAKQAASLEDVGSVRALPPLGLPGAPSPGGQQPNAPRKPAT